MPLNRYHLAKWSKLVRSTYGNKCAFCGTMPDGTYEKRIEAHHIVPLYETEELSTDIKNGIPLCNKCHRWVHNAMLFPEHEIYYEAQKKLNRFIANR